METDTPDGVLRHSSLWALSSTEMANQPFVKTVMGSRLRGIRESDKGIHGVAQPPQHRRRAAAHETDKEYVAIRSEARRSCGSGGPCPAFETTPARRCPHEGAQTSCPSARVRALPRARSALSSSSE